MPLGTGLGGRAAGKGAISFLAARLGGADCALFGADGAPHLLPIPHTAALPTSRHTKLCCPSRRLSGPTSATFLLPRSVSHLHPGTAMLGTAVRLSVLLGLLGFGNGQMFHMGPCPDPPVQEDFDISKV